ncbi:MAG: hypothetical protein GVY28_09980, partial [Alphaproteobacteria bacterium]|nr:hypothetical protein [Alphaproteobacteria bacterium]
MSDPGLFLDLAKVLGLLCTAFTGLIVARAAIEQRSQIAWDLTAGAVLGAAAVLAMSLPTVVAPGIIVDPRAAILVWAAPVGGWPAALVAAAVAVGYRLPMGGPGAIGGIFIIVASITLGAVLARYLRRRGAVLGPEHVALVTIGLLVFSVAGYLLIRPLDVGIATMLRTLPANGTMTVVGTLVLGGLIVIDERRRALLRRSRALEAEARDLAAARADFVADLGHEVRGPLSALQGFAQRLGAGPLDADQRRALGGVRVAVDQLARLMDDVLDSAKGEAGTLSLAQAPLDPAETVRQAAAMVEAEAAGKGLTLTVAIASDVPGAVAGDALRLRQIALNLISNAVKFTDRGSVTVRLAPWRRPGDGAPGLRLSVADTGIGIAATELDRVFDRFGRAGTAARGDRPGTGLGLGIARSLARAMGGDLRLDSAPGRGTTATADVALPPTAASVAMPAPAAAPQTG